MTRRTLFKVLALLPLVGPAITKALAGPALVARRASRVFVPGNLPQWDHAVDGLEDAGKWVVAFERSRLPKDLVFPREGQVWEAIRDCEVSFHAQICWQGPPGMRVPAAAGQLTPAQLAGFMGFGEANLRRGEQVRILPVDGPKPLDVQFLPVRHQELQEEIVPEEIRKLPGYHGYTLQLRTAKTLPDFNRGHPQTYFTEAFRLVQEAA